MIAQTTIQGFFYFYFDLIFLLLATKMWLHFKKEGNALSKYFAISFFLAGIEYFMQFVATNVFHQNVLIATLLATISYAVFIISIGFVWMMLPYLFPQFPFKIAMIAYIVIEGAISIYTIYPFRPAFINQAGIIDFGIPVFAALNASMLLMVTFIPIGAMFVYRTLKNKLYIPGFGMGFGLIVLILFLPVTYQVKDFDSYVFFSILTAVGFTLVALGVVFHPFLTAKKGREVV